MAGTLHLPTRLLKSAHNHPTSTGRQCHTAHCSTSTFRVPTAVGHCQKVDRSNLAVLPSRQQLFVSSQWQQRCRPSCRKDALMQTGKARCSGGAGLIHPDEARDVPMLSLTVPTTGMAKRGLGSSGGAAVLERKKLDLSQKTGPASSPKLDDSGGAGGIGKSIFNGGGGDDDGGDDDDYFDYGDEGGDDGEGLFKTSLRELYDPDSIKAVLQEWGRTVSDIPLFIRQSVEMGLFSSAQLVRFMAVDVRPSMTRAATRALSPQVSRGVVGRLMADPAFAQKMLMEQLFVTASSLTWEYRQRGDRFFQEFDLVAINTLSLSLATGALVWLIAPNRSHGAVHKFSWQNKLHSLPNHVFDVSTPLHRHSLSSRMGSFGWKTLELAFVGAVSGLSMSVLGNAAVRARQLRNPDFQPSVPIPGAQRSANGLALSMGVFSNMRYQAVSGIDRVLSERINFMWVYLLLSAGFRGASHWIGQPTRLYLQGLPTKVPDHKLKQRQQQRALQEAAAQLQYERRRQQEAAVAAAKPKRREGGSSGFEMTTRQRQRHPEPSMALAAAPQ